MAKKRKLVPQPEESSSSEEEEEEPRTTDEQSDEEVEEEEDDDDQTLEDDEDDDEEEKEEEEEEEEEEEDEEEEEEDDEEEEEEEEEEEVEESESSKRESIKKLLEPFGKDQLIEILKEAAMKNRSIIDRISRSADTDPVHRKIFVHGLGWDATDEVLLNAFFHFGQIEQCNVIMDKNTGKSKGYGFVVFKTRDGARKALAQPQKKIGNRMTSCQLASYGPPAALDATGRKIFVANVAPHVNLERLRAFFGAFGEIEEGPLGYDRITGRLKGFALFVYRTAEGCRKALEEPVKLFDGCEMHCRMAVEGVRGQKNQVVGEQVVGSAPAVAAAAAGMQSSDMGIGYAMGLNAGMVGQNLNVGQAAAFMGHNAGLGVMNPGALGASVNPTGLPHLIANGVSPSVNRGGAASSVGIGAGYGAGPASTLGVGGGYGGGQLGINSISPSVIGSYGSQAALQGLGAYQSVQLGQSSGGALARSHSGVGSRGNFSSLPRLLG